MLVSLNCVKLERFDKNIFKNAGGHSSRTTYATPRPGAGMRPQAEAKFKRGTEIQQMGSLKPFAGGLA